MGRISRRHLNKALEDRIDEIFWEHLASLDSPELIKEFLLSLLSRTEQVMLAKRLAIAILLSREYTYEYIDETLKVSKSTIATVHRELLIGAAGYSRAIASTEKKKAKATLWDSLEEILLQMTLPARYGSAKFKIKSAIGKDIRKRKYQKSVL